MFVRAASHMVTHIQRHTRFLAQVLSLSMSESTSSLRRLERIQRPSYRVHTTWRKLYLYVIFFLNFISFLICVKQDIPPYIHIWTVRSRSVAATFSIICQFLCFVPPPKTGLGAGAAFSDLARGGNDLNARSIGSFKPKPGAPGTTWMALRMKSNRQKCGRWGLALFPL